MALVGQAFRLSMAFFPQPAKRATNAAMNVEYNTL